MVKEILLNDTLIHINSYQQETVNGLIKISVEFKVTSKEYHDITTLLYEETFDVNVPERDLSFKGKIHQYSTSVTNLYEKGRVGTYKLSLIETEN
ncbi:DUF3219 family protein [Bacillus sp. T33-2]|uniref:DUF3219 family protein n=1 Tax=Bacillus sp. T33-2 TaxID=2054168 RepID=UPI000C78C181|nr:DUF3219 family protein [Bacillus sp. T33-2]PLR95291.1 DUF3219 domain-containing protein [Bacillus sp. T33-2]